MFGEIQYVSYKNGVISLQDRLSVLVCGSYNFDGETWGALGISDAGKMDQVLKLPHFLYISFKNHTFCSCRPIFELESLNIIELQFIDK